MPRSLKPLAPHASSVLVKQSEFFTALPPALLTDMSQKFRVEEWDKDILVDPDVLLKRFHILLDGRLEMRRANMDTGREITLELLQAGDSFDVVTLLDNQPHDVNLVPLSKLRLLSVSMETMRQWIWTYPELNQQFMPYLARKLRQQEDQASDLVLHDVPTRLSRIILENLNRMQTFVGKQEKAHKDHLLSGFSDDLLARMIGSVRQVVNKQLQEWKGQGVIDKKRSELIIKDLESLNEEAKIVESKGSVGKFRKL